MGNLLPISDNRNILENRIQSFNTDIKIVNKKRIIHELDNKVFDNEFNKMINADKRNHYVKLLDYNKLYHDDDNNEDDDDNTEEQGLYRKINYDKVTEDNIVFFSKIENKILNLINKNDKLKIKGGYNIIDSDKFKIVQRKINYILYNKNNRNELVYDGEIVIYRDMKNHGKHIGFKVLIQRNNIHIIDIKIKGIVVEDKIHMYIASNELEDNLIYYEFADKYVITYNPREKEITNMSPMNKVWLMRKRNKELRLDRGTQQLDDNTMLKDFMSFTSTAKNVIDVTSSNKVWVCKKRNKRGERVQCKKNELVQVDWPSN